VFTYKERDINFSVVIPLFNKAKYISRAIESIFKQTINPAEIIVVDDGSTDGGMEKVLEFCKRYRNIKFILQKNQGPASARNRGIYESSCELLNYCKHTQMFRKEWLKWYLTSKLPFNPVPFLWKIKRFFNP